MPTIILPLDPEHPSIDRWLRNQGLPSGRYGYYTSAWHERRWYRKHRYDGQRLLSIVQIAEKRVELILQFKTIDQALQFKLKDDTERIYQMVFTV